MRSAPSEQCDNVSDRGVTGSQIKTEYALIAQSVEHAAVNRGVTGSSHINGLEGRAAQSNNPVDCCDRERPSARRRTNRVLLSPP